LTVSSKNNNMINQSFIFLLYSFSISSTFSNNSNCDFNFHNICIYWLITPFFITLLIQMDFCRKHHWRTWIEFLSLQ
jgi:hypothetical protein